jgi:16S rRNA (guanine1207-N2)-methyltransferase
MNRKNEELEHYFAAHPKSKPVFGLVRAFFREKPFEFTTASGVFSKMRIDLGTRLLIEQMVLPKNGCVLDIGCGYGAIGIAAAVFNPCLKVVMSDVNIRAVWLAKQNVEKNNVENVEVRRGSLYEPVRDLVFNCVLSNPPVSAGMKTVQAIIAGAPEVMADKATFQMVIRSKIGGKRLQTFFLESFGNVDVLARESGYRILIAEK